MVSAIATVLSRRNVRPLGKFTSSVLTTLARARLSSRPVAPAIQYPPPPKWPRPTLLLPVMSFMKPWSRNGDRLITRPSANAPTAIRPKSVKPATVKMTASMAAMYSV